MPWFARFDEPIKIAGRAPLRTLAEARGYILELRKLDRERIEWRTVTGILSQAATHGEPYVSMARLAFSRALNKSRLKDRHQA
jgi:hypothetical protein